MSVFHKKFFDPSPPFAGIDIGDLSIKAVQMDLEKKHVSRVRSSGVKLHSDAIVDGTLMKPDDVAAGIVSACEQAGISTKELVCSLPETKAFLRIISIPQMTAAEVGEAIKWEMEANIPMAIDQVYYDWQILPRHMQGEPDKMSVLVIAVSRVIVDQFMAMLSSVGYVARRFEIESLAQAKSMLPEKHDETTMIVDIGDRRTSFLIVTSGIPVFTSSIPLSSEAMTDVIGKAMGLSRSEAEKVKFAHGIGSALKNDHIFQAVQPIIDGFTAEIRKSMNFYLTGLRYSQQIDNVILCGGGAKTKGLMPYLSRQIGKDVQFGDPWTNVQFKNLPPINRESSVQYTTAIGLAMQSDEDII